jgi:hypothetical protein
LEDQGVDGSMGSELILRRLVLFPSCN